MPSVFRIWCDENITILHFWIAFLLTCTMTNLTMTVFVYNVKLTLILLGFLPLLIFITLFATPRFKEYARKSFYIESDSESLLMETLSAAETVKGMGVEHSMRMKWEKK